MIRIVLNFSFVWISVLILDEVFDLEFYGVADFVAFRSRECKRFDMILNLSEAVGHVIKKQILIFKGPLGSVVVEQSAWKLRQALQVDAKQCLLMI